MQTCSSLPFGFALNFLFPVPVQEESQTFFLCISPGWVRDWGIRDMQLQSPKIKSVFLEAQSLVNSKMNTSWSWWEQFPVQGSPGQPSKVSVTVLLPCPLQSHCMPFPGPQPFKQSGTGIPKYHGRSHQILGDFFVVVVFWVVFLFDWFFFFFHARK